jgi:hypothetical protein
MRVTELADEKLAVTSVKAAVATVGMSAVTLDSATTVPVLRSMT